MTQPQRNLGGRPVSVGGRQTSINLGDIGPLADSIARLHSTLTRTTVSRAEVIRELVRCAITETEHPFLIPSEVKERAAKKSLPPRGN